MIITEKLLLYVRPDAEASQGMKFMLINPLHKYWMEDTDINLQLIEVNADVDTGLSEEDYRAAAIQTLIDKQQRVRAEAERRCVQLQEKIDSMKLITYRNDYE